LAAPPRSIFFDGAEVAICVFLSTTLLDDGFAREIKLDELLIAVNETRASNIAVTKADLTEIIILLL
jgi:low affinity Fe/Cu permease